MMNKRFLTKVHAAKQISKAEHKFASLPVDFLVHLSVKKVAPTLLIGINFVYLIRQKTTWPYQVEEVL